MGARAATRELEASGWMSRPVKEEVDRARVNKVAAGEPMFEGVVGYETP